MLWRNTKLLPKTYFCLQMKRKYLQQTTKIISQSLPSMKWMLTWMAKLIWGNSEELVTDTTTSFSITWRTLSQPTGKCCPPKLFNFKLKADYQFSRHQWQHKYNLCPLLITFVSCLKQIFNSDICDSIKLYDFSYRKWWVDVFKTQKNKTVLI